MLVYIVLRSSFNICLTTNNKEVVKMNNAEKATILNLGRKWIKSNWYDYSASSMQRQLKIEIEEKGSVKHNRINFIALKTMEFILDNK